MNKGFINITSGVIIAAVVLLGGYFIVYKFEFDLPKLLSNWETYENKNFSFKVDYPSRYIKENTVLHNNSDLIRTFWDSKILEEGYLNMPLQIVVNLKTGFGTKAEFPKENLNFIKNINIDGVIAEMYEGKHDYTQTFYKTTYVFFDKGDNRFIIHEITEERDVFENIISTFEFINSEVTSSDEEKVVKSDRETVTGEYLKKYKNKKYGFEFKYPPVAKVLEETNSEVTINSQVSLSLGVHPVTYKIDISDEDRSNFRRLILPRGDKGDSILLYSSDLEEWIIKNHKTGEIIKNESDLFYDEINGLKILSFASGDYPLSQTYMILPPNGVILEAYKLGDYPGYQFKDILHSFKFNG